MSESDHVTLSQDEAYDLLSNARRRFVISYLRDRDEEVSVSDLSDAVAAWENDADVDELTDQQVKRVYVSLYQTHLPKLDAADLIDYDRDRGTVRPTGTVAELDSYLPERKVDQRRWQAVYIALAAVGLLLYAIAAMVPDSPLGIPADVLSIVIIGAFGVVALLHYLSERKG